MPFRKCFNAQISRDTARPHQAIEFGAHYRCDASNVVSKRTDLSNQRIWFWKNFSNRFISFPLEIQMRWGQEVRYRHIRITRIHRVVGQTNAISKRNDNFFSLTHIRNIRYLIVATHSIDNQPITIKHKSTMARGSIHDSDFGWK